MAETKKMVVEGDVTLAYLIGERDDRQVLLQDKGAVTNGPETVPSSQRRLEALICEMLKFPDESEFDAMYKKLDDLRQKGLRPAEGQPDGKRENVRLRITVEVLN